MMTANEQKILETAQANANASIARERGRKPGAAAQAVATTNIDTVLAQDLQVADALSAAQAAYGQERDLLNQLLGQAQMADAFAKFSVTVTTSKLAYVKENKLYRALKGQKSSNGYEFLGGTWPEFCGLLGMSVEKADLDIANLKAFGEEALESMSRMGIGYRELRQYRKLPEDQKLALIEVAKAGDKEGFVELAEEIIAKHAKEKEQLAAQAQADRAALEAKDRVLADNATKINEQDVEIALLKNAPFVPREGSAARTRQEQALLDEVFRTSLRLAPRMQKLLLAADAALGDGKTSEAVQHAARVAVQFVTQQLADMAAELGIPLDLEERVEAPWTEADAAALAALEARNAAAADAAQQ